MSIILGVKIDEYDFKAVMKKITEILGTLARDYHVQSFAIEGSSGAIDPSLFKTYPDQHIAKQSAEELLGEGRLNAGGI